MPMPDNRAGNAPKETFPARSGNGGELNFALRLKDLASTRSGLVLALTVDNPTSFCAAPYDNHLPAVTAGAEVLFLRAHARKVDLMSNSLESAEDYSLFVADQRIAASFSDVMDG